MRKLFLNIEEGYRILRKFGALQIVPVYLEAYGALNEASSELLHSSRLVKFQPNLHIFPHSVTCTSWLIAPCKRHIRLHRIIFIFRHSLLRNARARAPNNGYLHIK